MFVKPVSTISNRSGRNHPFVLNFVAVRFLRRPFGFFELVCLAGGAPTVLLLLLNTSQWESRSYLLYSNCVTQAWQHVLKSYSKTSPFKAISSKSVRNFCRYLADKKRLNTHRHTHAHKLIICPLPAAWLLITNEQTLFRRRTLLWKFSSSKWRTFVNYIWHYHCTLNKNNIRYQAVLSRPPSFNFISKITRKNKLVKETAKLSYTSNTLLSYNLQDAVKNAINCKNKVTFPKLTPVHMYSVAVSTLYLTNDDTFKQSPVWHDNLQAETFSGALEQLFMPDSLPDTSVTNLNKTEALVSSI